MARGHQWLIGTGVVLALAAALALIAAGAQASLAEDGTIYVDADAPGPTHDGSSWDFAYTGLQDALETAGSGQQIWVAAGVYTPTWQFDAANPRSATFQMKNGVAIYGGFDPSADDVAWEDRDWVNNVAILSGDIGTQGDPDDNAHHVFYHPGGLDGTAILDGFTITGGNADGPFPGDSGGGMHNDGSSPMLANCTFDGNSALMNGGGLYNEDGSSPVLTNCTFTGNSAGASGGGVHDWLSSSVLTDCTFAGNSADLGGGMATWSYSSVTLTDCTFVGNVADTDGGGMFNEYYASPALTNCTFQGNTAGDEGGGMYNYYSSSPTLTNCTFAGNSADQYGGGIYNISDSSPSLTNCILWGDTAGGLPDEMYNADDSSTPAISYGDIQGGCDAISHCVCGDGNIDADPLFVDPDNGDFHLGPGSPCIDAGNNTAPDPLGLPDYDYEGDARIIDGDGDGDPIVDMGVDEARFRVYLPLVLRGY
jgi:parallel beta-helix repeat protein